LLANIELKADDKTYQNLLSAYSEKHRFYHTVHHIDDCLKKIDSCLELLANPYNVELAIWFHDAIYRPLSKSNEEDSAILAKDYLAISGASDEICKEVSSLVLATKHDGQRRTGDAAVLIDIDLSILGSDNATYDLFEKNVRKEYRYVPNFIFSKKRAELLSNFVNQEFIYTNEKFRNAYEEKARVNISRTVKRLLC